MAWYDAFNNMIDNFARRVASYVSDARAVSNNILAHYYTGDHRPQLKPRLDKETGRIVGDDNIIQNFTGLAVDRSVSRLFRGGVTFQLPKGSDEQQTYIDKVWDLNKKEIILYQVGLHGAVYGTPYFKVCPDELIDPYTGDVYPRLVALDPEIVRIRTDPQDMNEVILYQISYKIGEKWYAEITCRADYDYTWNQNGEAVPVPHEEREGEEPRMTLWRVDEWEQSATYGNQRTLVSQTPFPHDFPPIIHWKNLPSLKSCYGDSDIDDAVNIQDKSNFVVSNMAKIVKFYASPQTIGTGFNKLDTIEGSVGSFHTISEINAKVYNLEMNSDLASSRALAQDLRQSVFDVAREVDISSMSDKLGALTNFGLRVLYTDAMDKNDTKRQLYGDALKELNRRILVLAGNEKEKSNPGDVQWGDALPSNVKEDMEADKLALDMGVVDKETVSNRYKARYGVDWKTIQANLKKQRVDNPPLVPFGGPTQENTPLNGKQPVAERTPNEVV